MSKRDDLLVIKKDIENEVEARVLPLLDLRLVMEAFSDYILMDKPYYTYIKEVADWYAKYDFISVSKYDSVNYKIAYKG